MGRCEVAFSNFKNKTLVVLPLLPNVPIGVLGGLNPARLWLLSVLLGAVSFAGYVAERFFGPTRGVIVSGAALGLVSSTAVTLANARLARGGTMDQGVLAHDGDQGVLAHDGDQGVLAAAALAAGAVSLARTAVLAWIVAPDLGQLVAPAAAIAAACQALVALLLARRAAPGRMAAATTGRNPFDLPAMLQLGALLAVVDLLARAGRDWLGEGALFAVAMVSGIADVDAITLSLGGMVPGAMAARSAAIGVALAVATNTLAKATIATSLGGWGFGARYGVPAVVSLLLATAALPIWR